MKKAGNGSWEMWSICCFVAVSLATSVGAVAQSTALEVEEIEEVIVTGIRGKPRSVFDSPVPVDVFSTEDIEAVAYNDTVNVMMTLVPSFTVGRQAVANGDTFIRSPNMRGLPSDKTLVLVNSKRRHRTSIVVLGGAGQQGQDVATIPSIALSRIEVLRDGASAQYGSDAIAGVINFILKDASDGASITIDSGKFGAGDGAGTTIQGNIGLPLGANGFINLSGEYHESNATSRSDQYCEPWFCVDPSLPGYNPEASYAEFTESADYQRAVLGANTGFGDVVVPWGKPNQEALRFFVNAGYPIGDNTEVYAFGNYSESDSDGTFFYRFPRNGVIEQLREPDGGIYDPLERYPGGFTPRFSGEVFDYSILGGIRGSFGSGITYDISARRGESEISYTLANTLNPSLGRASKTSFKPGDLINQETQFQAEFTREFEQGFASPLLVAFGASYMDESYDLAGGELDSYEAGPYSRQDPFGFCDDAEEIAERMPTAAGRRVIGSGSSLNCADGKDPVYRAVSVGSNGFAGTSQRFSGIYERSSFAMYGDFSADLTDRLFLQGAIRYEDYEDFASEAIWKLAGKYDLTQYFGIRASAGTGFRAPTPGQRNTTAVQTTVPDGVPIATGLFPAGSPVGLALGASPLVPETSTSLTLGLTFTVGALNLTADYYRIDLADTTYVSPLQRVSTDSAKAEAYSNFLKLEAAGFPGANTIGGAQYFANGFDTRTEGIDVVGTYPINWQGNVGTTELSLAATVNRKELTSDPRGVLSAQAADNFGGINLRRGILTARHLVGDLTLTSRLSYYGKDQSRGQRFDPIWFTDLEAQYRINDMFRVSVGGRNIFDKYPERDTSRCCGQIYRSAIVDWQGAYWFGRITASF